MGKSTSPKSSASLVSNKKKRILNKKPLLKDVWDHRRSQKPIGIIDIGSNSIRLVVYDGLARTPMPIYNEKATCALGQGLAMTGRLSEQGVIAARPAIGRFIRLAQLMKVERLDILATAAVRDAEDGKDFVAELKKAHKVDIRILSGAQEAALAAWGVLCATPEAEGLVADLGGGSLELIPVNEVPGKIYASMPLGLLRLADESKGKRDKAEKIVDRALEGLTWLSESKDKTLYAVGGAWRSLARLCMAQTGYPLTVLDSFTMDRDEAERLLSLIAQQTPSSLEQMPGIPGISKKRVSQLPMAAMILAKLLKAARPSRLMFSVFGMREGRFFHSLPAKVRHLDPLIDASTQMAHVAGRFQEHGRELLDWSSSLFPDESDEDLRLRYAACLLGDIFWNIHPDYRAEQALLRIQRFPVMGLDHHGRAILALAVFARYQGEDDNPQAYRLLPLAGEEGARRARLIGLMLRLAHTVSGGVPNLLKKTSLVIEGNALVLYVPQKDIAFLPGVDPRFDKLARAVGCDFFEVRPMA